MKMSAPRIIQKRFSGRMSPGALTVSRGYVSLWDLKDSDAIVAGRGWDMPKAFATTQGVTQWREFLEPLSWGQWDAVTAWAEWKQLKPGDALSIEEFQSDYQGRWRDWREYEDTHPGEQREDYCISIARGPLYSLHLFKKAGE